MLKKKLLKKAVVIGMMATMITGCSQEVQTTNVDGLNSYKNASKRWLQLAAKETLRCADIVEEMFVNLHECIDKKGKNIENELKSARTLQKHYVLCGIARIGILSDDINGEVNIA